MQAGLVQRTWTVLAKLKSKVTGLSCLKLHFSLTQMKTYRYRAGPLLLFISGQRQVRSVIHPGVPVRVLQDLRGQCAVYSLPNDYHDYRLALARGLKQTSPGRWEGWGEGGVGVTRWFYL